MKRYTRTLFAALVVAMIGFSLGAMFITQNAGLVSAALMQLKFEELPGNPKLIGAPPQLKVTKETIDFLTKIQKDGKIVEVENDGSLKIK